MKKLKIFRRGNIPQGVPAIEATPVAVPATLCKPQDYKSQFMRGTSITARSGKTVYISPEHHERITKILRVIGKGEVSMFAYIHNVLEHHFATCKDEIANLYEDNLERKVF